MDSKTLTSSIRRQRLLYDASIVLTPVDSFGLNQHEIVDTSFFQGLYISDKKKSLNQQMSSKIQFGGRGRATHDVIRIHNELAISLNASSGSLRLLSGLHAHIVVFMSIAKAGDSVLLLPEEAGGHFATTSILKRLGLTVIPMVIDRKNMVIDRSKTLKLIKERKPDFIFVDRSEGLKYEDFSFLGEFKNIVKVFDASQYLPQIMFGDYQSPLSWGFDLMLFTVHKSFPGPQKAGVVAREDGAVWNSLQKGLGSYVSSAHIENTYKFAQALLNRSELIELSEKLTGLAYNLEVQLAYREVDVVFRKSQGESHWPNTQHIWIRCPSKEIAFRTFKDLMLSRIQVNYRFLPYGLGWGLRLGTTAAIGCGLESLHLPQLADIIAKILKDGYSLQARHAVRKLRMSFNFENQV